MSESARFIARSYAHRNQILKALGFRSYAHYIASIRWAMIRKQVLNSRSKCTTCAERATQIHHEHYSYDNLSGNSLDGLHPICRACHDILETDQEGGKIFDFARINRRWHFLYNNGRAYAEIRFAKKPTPKPPTVRTNDAEAMPKETKSGLGPCEPMAEWKPSKPKFISRRK